MQIWKNYEYHSHSQGQGLAMNAFAESIFRTLKYHHSYPRRRSRDILSVEYHSHSQGQGSVMIMPLLNQYLEH